MGKCAQCLCTSLLFSFISKDNADGVDNDDGQK
jgi:hypothetical protein